MFHFIAEQHARMGIKSESLQWKENALTGVADSEGRSDGRRRDFGNSNRKEDPVPFFLQLRIHTQTGMVK